MQDSSVGRLVLAVRLPEGNLQVWGIMAKQYMEAFHRFLDAWLTRRSIPDTLAWIGEDCTGFGTGADEVAVLFQGNREGGLSDRELYERDIREAPNPVSYVLRTLLSRPMGHGACVVMAVMDIQTSILEQEVAFHGLRMTFVFSEGPDGLKLRHDHVSFPTTLHRMGEAYPIKELEERMLVFERMLRERTKTLQEAYAELASIVNLDKLTGILSRHRLDEVLEAELQRLRRYGAAFSVLFFDIDRFKSFNDRHGHIKGDEVLRLVSAAAGECIRETDSLGRWGGDEFLILLPQTVGEAARKLADRILSSVRQIGSMEGNPITISLGMVTGQPDDTVDTLMSRVDAAMYRAKSLGGDTLVAM